MCCCGDSPGFDITPHRAPLHRHEGALLAARAAIVWAGWRYNRHNHEVNTTGLEWKPMIYHMQGIEFSLRSYHKSRG